MAEPEASFSPPIASTPQPQHEHQEQGNYKEQQVGDLPENEKLSQVRFSSVIHQYIIVLGAGGYNTR